MKCIAEIEPCVERLFVRFWFDGRASGVLMFLTVEWPEFLRALKKGWEVEVVELVPGLPAMSVWKRGEGL